MQRDDRLGTSFVASLELVVLIVLVLGFTCRAAVHACLQDFKSTSPSTSDFAPQNAAFQNGDTCGMSLRADFGLATISGLVR